MSDDEMIQKEIYEGFDRSKAEDVMQSHFNERLGGPIRFFESRTPGVVAFERLSWIDGEKVNFNKLSGIVGEAVGVEVVSVVNCDWSFDEGCDEEATAFAFSIPSLGAGYNDDSRNLLETGEDLEFAQPRV